MMRSLAEFIMRGRLQASILAMLSVLLPLLPQGTIGLVTLRKGAREGGLMVLAGMLPLFITLGFGGPDGAVFWGTLLGLLAVYFPAIVLRATQSWSFALQVAIVSSGVLSILALQMLPSLMPAFAEALQRLLMVTTATETAASLASATLSFTRVSGFVAAIMLLNGLTGLLLARWWQALLYNPGGFGEGATKDQRIGDLKYKRQLVYWFVPSGKFGQACKEVDHTS
ncbi:MAG: hypothetical protein AAFZ92_04505, partial [Pseudomonadota bacterium]